MTTLLRPFDVARRAAVVAAGVLVASGAMAQVPLEQAVHDLESPDAAVRLRTVQLLKDARHPDSAIAVSKLAADVDDLVQLDAIAASLEFFLDDEVEPGPRGRRIPVLFGGRRSGAEAAFLGGASVLGTAPVPGEVLVALGVATRDDNPRVASEALYAFGTLASDLDGAPRLALQRTSASDLAALVSAVHPGLRRGAVRVIGRLYARAAGEAAVDETVGDALVSALNDTDGQVRSAAMEALGALRYDRSVKALSDLVRFYERGSGAEEALNALAHIAHPSSAELFTELLKHRQPGMRRVAVEGLARLGDAKATSVIDEALSREVDDSVMLAARFAAVVLTNRNLDPISEALFRGSLRDQAMTYLVEIASQRAALFLQQSMDPDERVRHDVTIALSSSTDPAAVQILERLSHDKDPQIARSAQRGLTRQRGPGAPKRRAA